MKVGGERLLGIHPLRSHAAGADPSRERGAFWFVVHVISGQ